MKAFTRNDKETEKSRHCSAKLFSWCRIASSLFPQKNSTKIEPMSPIVLVSSQISSKYPLPDSTWVCLQDVKCFLNALILEKGGERQTLIFVVPLIYALIGQFFYVPSSGIKPKTLAYRTMLELTELPSQSSNMVSVLFISVSSVHSTVPGTWWWFSLKYIHLSHHTVSCVSTENRFNDYANLSISPHVWNDFSWYVYKLVFFFIS